MNPPEGECESNEKEVLRRATREIENYSVGLVAHDVHCGCGTLIEFDGIRGILTAHHVWNMIRSRGGRVGLTLAEHRHSFFLEPELYRAHEVGTPSEPDEYTEIGPDLAFLEILAPTCIGTILSKKSFYVLRTFRFAPSVLEPWSWFIAGTPAALTEHADVPDMLNLGTLVGGAQFESREERNEFDYVSLKVNSGTHSFPGDYQGLSGGGMWIVPFVKRDIQDSPSLDYQAPELAGVAFFQGPPQNSFQSIYGHGPKSIFQTLRELIRRSRRI